ncbi:PE family protein [Rhodococcus sp. UNC363MFTsu5.1]|uniref:PE family protein n=1 Tax=Rhodococcus sp. UNC363MFTsu5.1 TaxID=1449069 RepID=UPI00048235ED|nr:PE family protein [Rhodococcus sp. UNC363MFTsu5.1]
MSGHVFVAPEALISAATQLDALAARLEATVRVNAPALHLAPAGSEEVSAMVASSFNSVADSFLPSAATGIAELRVAADTLRKHAAEYENQDHSLSASLAAGM